MFNLGLHFETLDLTKAKVLLNLGLKSFVIQAIVFTVGKLRCFVEIVITCRYKLRLNILPNIINNQFYIQKYP